MTEESFERTYVVTAPSNFVPGSIYHVCISIHYSPDPVEVNAVIHGTDKDTEVDLVCGSVTVSGNESKTLPLQTQCDWICDHRHFSITVTGKGGITFKRTTAIRCLPKRYSIFIQCDQPVYLPGQTIEFQVITLDLELRPFETDKIQVVVEDSRMTVVKKWPFQVDPKCSGRQSEYDMKFRGGVFTGRALIPTTRPLYGEWLITATATDGIERARKHIIVAESVSSVFHVILEVPKYITSDDDTAEFNVTARFHHGKPVIGEAKLTLAPPIDCRCDQTPLQMTRLILSPEGHVKMDLPVGEKWIQWRTLSGKELTATVEVFDPGLDAIETRTAKVMYYAKRDRIVITQTAPDFVPNMNHRITILLLDHSGNLVRNPCAKVMIVYSFHKDGKHRISLESPVPESGILNLDLEPKEDSNVILFAASYNGETVVSQASKIQSLSTKFLRLMLLTPFVYVGGEAEFEVASTFQLTTLIYVVMSRSVVVSTDVLYIQSGTWHRWTIPVTNKMAPEPSIVVYFVSACGEVVMDALGFRVHNFLKTPLKIDLQQELYSPGDKVNIRMRTDPDSDVFILSTDERFFSDSRQNYLTVEDVAKDLLGYSSDTWRKAGWCGNEKSNGVLVRRSSSTFIEDVFLDSGLILICNGMYVRQRLPQSIMPSYARGAESFMNKSETLKTYEDLTNSWIRAKYQTQKSGYISKEYTLEYKEANWTISAFALSQKTGLGISSIQRIRAATDLKLAIHSTKYLMFEETACVEAVVTNESDQGQEVEVKILASDADVMPGPDEKEESRIQRGVAKAKTFTVFPYWVTPRLKEEIHLKVSLSAGVKKFIRDYTIQVRQQVECIHVCRPFLLHFDTVGEFHKQVHIHLPENLIPGTEKSSVCFSGDVFGPIVANINQLLYMNLSFKTAEHSVLSAAPSFLAMNYLKSRGKECLHDESVNMDYGYLEMVSRYRRDGSFSPSGETNQYGCTWLTSYFLQWILDLRSTMYTDLALIQRGLCFLADKQSHDGIFEDQTPRPFRRPTWDVRSIVLSAFSIIPFILYRNAGLPPEEIRKMRISVPNQAFRQRAKSFELQANANNDEAHPMLMGTSTQSKSTRVNDIIEKTVTYLENSLKAAKNAYELAFTVYVLHLVDSDKKEDALTELESLSQEEDGMKYWVLPDSDAVNIKRSNSKQFYPNSQSIQIAAYVLLTYSLRGGNKADVIPVLRWLINQMNDRGGYCCAFDTVLAVKAIATCAKHFSSKKTDLTFQAVYEGGHLQLSANRDNSIILQRASLPVSAQNVQISAKGQGLGLAMVNSAFSVFPRDEKPYFLLECVLDPYSQNLNKFYLYLKIAVSDFHATFRLCRLAILVVGIPSGYSINFTEFNNQEAVQLTPNLQGYEQQVHEGTVHFCFENLTIDTVTLKLPVVKVSDIHHLKPTCVAIIDYYDHSRYNSVLYTAPCCSNEKDL